MPDQWPESLKEGADAMKQLAGEAKKKLYEMHQESKERAKQPREVIGEAFSIPEPISMAAYQIPLLRDTRLHALPELKQESPEYKGGSDFQTNIMQQIAAAGYDKVREALSMSPAEMIAWFMALKAPAQGRNTMVENLRQVKKAKEVSRGIIAQKEARGEPVYGTEVIRESTGRANYGGRPSGEFGGNTVLQAVLEHVKRVFPRTKISLVASHAGGKVRSVSPQTTAILAQKAGEEAMNASRGSHTVLLNPAYPGYDFNISWADLRGRLQTSISSVHGAGTASHELPGHLVQGEKATSSDPFTPTTSQVKMMRQFIEELWINAPTRIRSEFGNAMMLAWEEGRSSRGLFGGWTGEGPRGSILALNQFQDELAANAAGYVFYRNHHAQERSAQLVAEAMDANRVAGKGMSLSKAEATRIQEESLAYGKQKALEDFGPLADVSMISYMYQNNVTLRNMLDTLLSHSHKRWVAEAARRKGK